MLKLLSQDAAGDYQGCVERASDFNFSLSAKQRIARIYWHRPVVGCPLLVDQISIIIENDGYDTLQEAFLFSSS